MARKTVIIEQLKKGDNKLVFHLDASFVWAPGQVGIILERPFNKAPREERADGTKINPSLGDKDSACYKLVEALKKIDGIAHVEMRGYWMCIKIGRAFKHQVSSIMLAVIESIDTARDEDISFSGYSPYIQRNWKEFHFEVADRTFLPRLITTIFDESAGMVIPGTWDDFAEGTAFASGFKVDSITRVPAETDSWTIEMAKSLGSEEPELITATCTTPWIVNRTGKPEDGGRRLYGGKLHFNATTGKGVIYDPEHN